MMPIAGIRAHTAAKVRGGLIDHARQLSASPTRSSEAVSNSRMGKACQIAGGKGMS